MKAVLSPFCRRTIVTHVLLGCRLAAAQLKPLPLPCGGREPSVPLPLCCFSWGSLAAHCLQLPSELGGVVAALDGITTIATAYLPHWRTIAPAAARFIAKALPRNLAAYWKRSPLIWLECLSHSPWHHQSFWASDHRLIWLSKLLALGTNSHFPAARGLPPANLRSSSFTFMPYIVNLGAGCRCRTSDSTAKSNSWLEQCKTSFGERC